MDNNEKNSLISSLGFLAIGISLLLMSVPKMISWFKPNKKRNENESSTIEDDLETLGEVIIDITDEIVPLSFSVNKSVKHRNSVINKNNGKPKIRYYSKVDAARAAWNVSKETGELHQPYENPYEKDVFHKGHIPKNK